MQTADPNAHIGAYLKYYVSLPSAPNYAVMLEGPWGIGKTFLTKRLLSMLIKEPQKYVYVSLYGLSTPEQLDDALFGAFYRVFDTFGAKMAMGAVRGMLKAFRVDPEFKRSDFLSKCAAELYVFDDLERCNMPVQQALGHINQIVEHSGGKVVILANEAVLKNDNEYKALKEKVVGKTLIVQPMFDAALAYFLDQIRIEEAKTFLIENSATIKSIFERSNTQNFRILQQSLWDFERFHSVLERKLTDKSEAMQALLAHFLAYSFELKSGALDDQTIRQTADKFEDIFDTPRATGDKPKQPLSELREKYRLTMNNVAELRGGPWAKILLDGLFDADIVAEALRWTGWFVDPADQPAWRTIWHRLFRSSSEVEAAIKVVMGQIADRQFSDAGEILHVFGLMVDLASIGAIDCSTSEVLKKGKCYVGELRADRRLQLPPEFEHEEDFRFGSHGGLGFTGTNIPEFNEFARYLQEQRIRAKSDLYAEQAAILLENLQSNPDAFCEAISETGDPRGQFCRTPLLSKIDPTAFVDALFKSQPEVQDMILMRLYGRYDGARLLKDLSDECEWVQSLVSELQARADALGPLDKDRVRFMIGYYFKHLPNTDAADDRPA